MIGIYKIENLINHKIYIGQSVHIKRRWAEHCMPSADSIISKAIHKYGKENFSFEILEKCLPEELIDKEAYYIKKYNSLVPNGYNIQEYQDGIYNHYDVYSKETLLKIIDDLKKENKTIKEICEKFNLSKSTIYRINNGEIHRLSDVQYPIRNIKKSAKIQKYCIDCGVEITSRATRCPECYALSIRKVERPSREELKMMIRKDSFATIARRYNVSDNSIRKWCQSYNLPHRVKDIKTYSDIEWDKI